MFTFVAASRGSLYDSIAFLSWYHSCSHDQLQLLWPRNAKCLHQSVCVCVYDLRLLLLLLLVVFRTLLIRRLFRNYEPLLPPGGQLCIRLTVHQLKTGPLIHFQTRKLCSESTNIHQSGGSRFRTLDSRIRSVIRIATKIVPLGPWAMTYPSKKFRQNPFTSLRVIRRTDRQTDRQTDKQTDRQTDRTKNITSFFGGGNNFNKH